MKKIHSAGIVLYRTTEQGIVYLLLKHAAGGHWDFPKGKVEEGETDRQAALRELQEETGIAAVTIVDDFFATIAYNFTDYDGKLAHKTVNFLLGSTTQENVTLSHEHENFAWLLFEDAHDQLIHATAKEVLAKAEKTVRLECPSKL